MFILIKYIERKEKKTNKKIKQKNFIMSNNYCEINYYNTNNYGSINY